MDPDELWARQERRGSLADAYWDLAGGRPGLRVADIGCGAGYFTLRYASMAGPTGHVHATDIDHATLDALRARMDPVHHAHVTTEELDIERASIPDLAFDAVFCTDVLHHVKDLPAALRHLRAPRARLVIGEFDPMGPEDIGPPIEDRVAPAKLLALLRDAGWKVDAWRALEHEHYAIVAR